MDPRARDRSLIERWRDGDIAARDQLLASVEPFVRKRARRDEDLAQDLRLTVLRCLDGYDPERGCFTTYCGWLIRSHLSHRRNRDRRVLFTSLDDPRYEDGLSLHHMLGQPDPESIDHDLGVLFRALDQLPPEQQRLILESMRDGQQVVAARLGVTRQAIEQCRDKIVARLRRLML